MESTVRHAARWLALSALFSPALAGVLVVDASSPTGFTQIQAAVDAANDGDTILVGPGFYAGFAVHDKALDLVADTSAGSGPVHIDGRVIVNGLAASRTFTLHGFEVRGTSSAPCVVLAGNAGSVRIQGCSIAGADAPPCAESINGGVALDVDLCQDVALVACTLRGGDGGNTPIEYGYGGIGGDGVTPNQSRIAFYDCSVRAGDGGGAVPAVCGATIGYGGAGGSGAWIASCPILFASDTTFEGGRGGPAGSGFSFGSPGYGLVAFGLPLNGPTRAWWLASSARGGPPACGNCPAGTDVTVLAPSTLTNCAGAARKLVMRGLAREHELVRLHFVGAPGERVELVISDTTRFALAAGGNGVLLAGSRAPSPVLQAGTIGASGVLDLPWVVNDLGAGIAARRIFLQPLFVDALGRSTLGSPRTLVLLDSAY